MKHISRNSSQVFIHAILQKFSLQVTVHAHDTWITMESYYRHKSKSAFAYGGKCPQICYSW